MPYTRGLHAGGVSATQRTPSLVTANGRGGWPRRHRYVVIHMGMSYWARFIARVFVLGAGRVELKACILDPPVAEVYDGVGRPSASRCLPSHLIWF